LATYTLFYCFEAYGLLSWFTMRNTDRRRSSTHFTSHRAARILQVSKKTLHNWVNSGKVSKPDTNPENGYLLWTMGDIDAIRIQLGERESGQ
jgi:hypothetical protein